MCPEDSLNAEPIYEAAQWCSAHNKHRSLLALKHHALGSQALSAVGYFFLSMSHPGHCTSNGRHKTVCCVSSQGHKQLSLDFCSHISDSLDFHGSCHRFLSCWTLLVSDGAYFNYCAMKEAGHFASFALQLLMHYYQASIGSSQKLGYGLLWKATRTKTQSQFNPVRSNMLCLCDQRIEFAAGTTMGASICW